MIVLDERMFKIVMIRFFKMLISNKKFTMDSFADLKTMLNIKPFIKNLDENKINGVRLADLNDPKNIMHELITEEMLTDFIRKFKNNCNKQLGK